MFSTDLKTGSCTLNPCTSCTYTRKFKKYIFKNQLEDKLHLVNIWKITTDQPRKFLVKKLRGPCFGFSRALYEIEETHNYLTKKQFIELALFYSLFDLVRYDCEIILKDVGKDHPFAQLSEKYSLKKSHSFIGSKYIANELFSFIKSQRNMKVVLSIWSLTKDAFTPPHSLYLSVNDELKRYVFYDSEFKRLLREDRWEEFHEKCIAHLKKKHPNYFTNRIVWRIFWR